MMNRFVFVLRNIKAFINLSINYISWMFSKNKITNSCLNKTHRKNDVVVSLTSFPGRIEIVWQTIITLLNQTYKPDRIVLWLADSQFPDKKMPKNLQKLIKYGLEIKYCDDLKSYKKLIPSILEFPDSIIITVDDDVFYKKDMVEKLIDSYNKNNNEIHCHRVSCIQNNNQGYYISSNKVEDISKYSYKLVGIGGVLYPPNSLSKIVVEKELFMKYAPTNDDIWFWFMAVRNHIKIRLIKDYQEGPNITFGSLSTEKLSDKNDVDDGLFWKCLNYMMLKFPECKILIEKN